MKLKFPERNGVERVVETGKENFVANDDCNGEISDGDIREGVLQVVVDSRCKVIKGEQQSWKVDDQNNDPPYLMRPPTSR
jgi:hypothetical protein